MTVFALYRDAPLPSFGASFKAAVHDPSIMLCHTVWRRHGEHDGNILKRHIVGKRDRSPRKWAGSSAWSKFFCLILKGNGYFLEIMFHLLIYT